MKKHDDMTDEALCGGGERTCTLRVITCASDEAITYDALSAWMTCQACRLG